MEPPGNGRKHAARPSTRRRSIASPQWSRPVMGGNTAGPGGVLFRELSRNGAAR